MSDRQTGLNALINPRTDVGKKRGEKNSFSSASLVPSLLLIILSPIRIIFFFKMRYKGRREQKT